MEIAAQSPSDHQRKSAAGQHPAATRAAATLVDNRPATVHQRELAVVIGDSPRVISQQSSRRLAISPRVIAQRRRLESLFGNALPRASAFAHLDHRSVIQSTNSVAVDASAKDTKSRTPPQTVVVQRGTGSSKPAEKPVVTKESVLKKEVALFVLQKAYGDSVVIELKSHVIFHDNKATFVETFKRFHDGKDPEDAVGFTVKSEKQEGREIHILKHAVTFDAVVHEMVHHNASNEWNQRFRNFGIHEAVTQILTFVALYKAGIKEESGAYAAEVKALLDVNSIFDSLPVVVRAYFLGDISAMNQPIGSAGKSLKQTAWKVDGGEWDVPELNLEGLNFEAVAKGGTPGEKKT